MTARRRSLAVGLGLALVAVGAPAASAAPDAGAIELSVAGAPEATTLFGDVVVVPGHTQTQTLHVTNVGELPGTLTVEVVGATLTGAPAAFFDDLTVNGVTATALDGVNTSIAPARTLEPGEVATVPVTLEFDVENPAPDVGSTFTFAVRATLTGETPVTPSPDPTPGVDPAPGADPAPAETPAATASASALAETGGFLAMNRTELLWAAAALLAGGLVALTPALRRSRGRHVA